MKKRIYATVLFVAALGFSVGFIGCNSFERTAFQALSASKATLDQAQADYEARTIPHTEIVYNAINAAKDADIKAVNAMVLYEQVKIAGGSASAVSDQQAVVQTALTNLSSALLSIKAVSTPVKAAPASTGLDYSLPDSYLSPAFVRA